MKHFTRILISCGLVTALSTGYAMEDQLNIAGTYKCTGYSSYGESNVGIWTIKLDPAASDFAHNFGSYSFSSQEVYGGKEKDSYSGQIAAHGDSLSIYFQNDDKRYSATDRGVGTATITHVQDGKGTFTTMLTVSYYVPSLMPGKIRSSGSTSGNGSSHCVKIS